MDDRPQTAFRFPPSALFLLLLAFLTSCTTSTPTTPTQTITAYATASAQPWMEELFACAGEQNILVEITAQNPDIFLRIGEPADLTLPAYQIGEEEILIVVHREGAIQNLRLPEVQAVFAGQGDAEIWVFASGVDLQWVFEATVMEGRSVTSLARVAVSPQEMSEALASDPVRIGILPKHWVTEPLRAVYSAGTFPVLAITNGEPQGAVRAVLGCLHSK